jgi:hypothetical protein
VYKDALAQNPSDDRAHSAPDYTLPDPLQTRLRDDERVHHYLVNTVVGVDRIDTGETIRPGDDASAYLGLTDSRIVIIVESPLDRERTFVTSHNYQDIVDVVAQTETLTAKIKFETVSGQQWLFTSREDDIGTVQTFLSIVCPNTSRAELTALADHCRTLSGYLATGDWEQFDDCVAQAKETAEQLRNDSTSETGDATHTIVTDLHRLARDRYILAGRAKRNAARQALENGYHELSYRRARLACDRFKEALKRARQEGLETENAMLGLTEADEIADTSLGRLFATGRHQFSQATSHDDIDSRIEGLERALETYETIAALVSGDDTLSRDADERAREEAITVIDQLIDARLQGARAKRNSAIVAQDTNKSEIARNRNQSARTDIQRALELASTYPPGDADAIREHRAELFAKGDESE